MNTGRTIFSQLMDSFPYHEFKKCVQKYKGNYKIKSFSCLEHFIVMSFAQLTYRESLRDIETCLRAIGKKLYHIGIRSRISRNTISNANKQRDWKIYAELALVLISQARELYRDQELEVQLNEMVYALDSTTIDLCLSLFPWAQFRKRKSAIKMHTLLDLRGSIPAFIWVTDGSIHDVNVLDLLLIEPGAYYLFDRGYLDYSKLYSVHCAKATFITRLKKNTKYRRVYSQEVDKSSGILCDQIIVFTGFYSAKNYPEKLRRIRFYDKENRKYLEFLTNDFHLPAIQIADLFKQRWKVEIFFKWVKQHLRIKAFYGTSENAVKSQIWIAISVYVLIAIIKKKLHLELSLYTILQILSITLFEKKPILEVLQEHDDEIIKEQTCKQLNLFD
jgi:hypothetical protein